MDNFTSTTKISCTDNDIGSHGIRTLVKLIRDQVYNSKILANRSFSEALQGTAAGGRRIHGASWPLRRSFGVP